MSHPHPKGNFVPRAVLMIYGLKTIHTARQNSLRAAISLKTTRPNNNAYPRPTVNSTRPVSNVFNKAHSHGNVTTVGPKAVVSDNKGKEVNAIKASACWVWKPNINVIDHVSKHNSASMYPKRFDYVDRELLEKGVIDNRCSRHMTGNMSYLSDCEEINGGYVAFRGGIKGGGLICLFAKATLDESNLWHRRLRTPSLSFMKPFRCPVTILNTLDHLGTKEDISPKHTEDDVGKKDSEVSKNRSGDSSKVGNKDDQVQENNISSTNINTNNTNYVSAASLNVNTISPTFNVVNTDELNAVFENINTVYPNDPTMPNLVNIETNDDNEEEDDFNNLETSINVSPTTTTRIYKDRPLKQVIGTVNTPVQTRSGKRAIGTKWVYKNKKDKRGIVVRNKARLVTQCHTQEEGIDFDEVFAPVARIEAIRLFLAYASYKDFVVYQMDVKNAFLYDQIEEEVYVCQPLGFEDPELPNKAYMVEKALYGLHQALRA
ncbi:putative ribonuclease H-like domain-containing protein [Tanacetum coccineum]